MGNVEVPAYKSIVTNEVFGKRVDPIEIPLFGKIEATRLLSLTKFTVPKQDEVIDFIITSAKKIDLNSLGKEKPSKEDSKITYFLKLLLPSEIENITKRDTKTLDHLRLHCSENDLQERRMYLKATSDIVPDRVLDEAKRFVEKEGSIIYTRAIENIGREKLNLMIRLLENRALPDSLYLEYLLDSGVRTSDALSVSGSYKNYQTVANQVRVLYNTLSSPKLMDQIKDTSYDFLKSEADLTVVDFVVCSTAKKAVKGLTGIIDSALQDARSFKDHRGFPNLQDLFGTETIQKKSKNRCPTDEHGCSQN